jgi:hypothetical protein
MQSTLLWSSSAVDSQGRPIHSLNIVLYQVSILSAVMKEMKLAKFYDYAKNQEKDRSSNLR